MGELGMLQVGGQLNTAELHYDATHLMILPKKHQMTRLIVGDVHQHGHPAGVNHL